MLSPLRVSAAGVASEFSPPPWLRNPHLQSTLPSTALWRWPVWQRSAAFRAASYSQIVQGDEVRLQAWLTPQPDQRAPWVLLLHGWLGDAHANYVLSLGAALHAQGYQVVRLNLRDHGGTEHLNEGVFHSCLLDDVLSVALRLQQDHDMQDLSMAGFSLGGNFALRCAAHAARVGLVLRKVVAVCPALDPLACDTALTTGVPVYARYFLAKWKSSLRRKQQLFPHRYDFTPWLELPTLTTLTDALVKRYVGFADYQAYYAGYSVLGPVLATLTTPCDVLLSDDDPIVPSQGALQLPSNQLLRVMHTQHGGHCGFITGWRSARWVDQWVIDRL